MLIRSQDKKQLLNLNNGYISIDFSNEKRVLFCGLLIANSEDYTCIGEYSTKEKAIKVLDMIEQRYDNLETAKVSKTPKHWIPFVFQMPADSEV